MKVKRYTIETKIRILREAQSRDKTIQDVCQERQQQQIHQLIQKHRDQSTELERQISDEAHSIRCENPNSHCFISAVNRSEWRVEKWSGWRESNPLHTQNPMNSGLKRCKSHCATLFSMNLTQFYWVDALIQWLVLWVFLLLRGIVEIGGIEVIISWTSLN